MSRCKRNFLFHWRVPRSQRQPGVAASKITLAKLNKVSADTNCGEGQKIVARVVS